MGSPISPISPRLGLAKLRNRVPTQMRRNMPLYLIVAILFLLVLNSDLIRLRGNPMLGRERIQRTLPGLGSTPVSGTLFPKKIWQTWKTDPYDMAKRDSDTARSWTSKNPNYRYELLTDDNDLVFVREAYGPNGFDRPDLVHMYEEINATIVKADLLRYMVMYAEGGVYADIDVEDLRSVRRFVPERFDERDVDMVIGIEVDEPQFRYHPILGSKSMSFCQWTFMCKPRLPVMLRLVERIMGWLADVAAEQGVAVSQVYLDFDEIISGTGPSAFTAAVLEEMSARSGETVTWDRFHDLDESKLVAGVLVLDVESFAAGQGHSDSGNHNARGALVKHHYHASNWPSRHPRFSHPVYGEVERCNWNETCVQRWDADVAAYKTLSAAEQEARMAERKAELDRELERARFEQEQAVKLDQYTAAVKKAEEEEAAKVRAVQPLALPVVVPLEPKPEGEVVTDVQAVVETTS